MLITVSILCAIFILVVIILKKRRNKIEVDKDEECDKNEKILNDA